MMMHDARLCRLSPETSGTVDIKEEVETNNNNSNKKYNAHTMELRRK
jgi:hypothetical protein